MSHDLESYYFSFDATGVAEIDAILQAVCDAGRAQHNTSGWTDDDFGESPRDTIQRAANAAAAGRTGRRSEDERAKSGCGPS